MGGHHYEHFYLDPKFWVAVSFVVFLLLVGRRLWTALTDAMDARAARVRAELAEASRLRSEAEAMLKQAEADRAAALREAVDISDGPSVVRFPKGALPPDIPALERRGRVDVLRRAEQADVLLVAVGSMAPVCLAAAERAADLACAYVVRTKFRMFAGSDAR